MQAKCVVKLRHDVRRGPSEDRAQPLDGYRADLLGLGLGVLTQPGRSGGQQSLERKIRSVLLVTGTTVTTQRPSRAAIEFARSLLTISAGRRLLASLPRAGSRSASRISPRSIGDPVGRGHTPRRVVA